ncbi:MAG: serine/threonine-protein kinase [Bacteriovoracia bacterium]
MGFKHLLKGLALICFVFLGSASSAVNPSSSSDEKKNVRNLCGEFLTKDEVIVKNLEEQEIYAQESVAYSLLTIKDELDRLSDENKTNSPEWNAATEKLQRLQEALLQASQQEGWTWWRFFRTPIPGIAATLGYGAIPAAAIGTAIGTGIIGPSFSPEQIAGLVAIGGATLAGSRAGLNRFVESIGKLPEDILTRKHLERLATKNLASFWRFLELAGYRFENDGQRLSFLEHLVTNTGVETEPTFLHVRNVQEHAKRLLSSDRLAVGRFPDKSRTLIEAIAEKQPQTITVEDVVTVLSAYRYANTTQSVRPSSYIRSIKEGPKAEGLERLRRSTGIDRLPVPEDYATFKYFEHEPDSDLASNLIGIQRVSGPLRARITTAARTKPQRISRTKKMPGVLNIELNLTSMSGEKAMSLNASVGAEDFTSAYFIDRSLPYERRSNWQESLVANFKKRQGAILYPHRNIEEIIEPDVPLIPVPPIFSEPKDPYYEVEPGVFCDYRSILGVSPSTTVYVGYRLVDADISGMAEPVALKKSDLARLRRQKASQGRIRSPNVIGVGDLVERGDDSYLVLELPPRSVTLRLALPRLAVQNLAPQNKKQGIRNTVEIILQVARGLRDAHNAGIIHQDLKPENVLISENGHAKITDFEYAKSATDINTQVSTESGRLATLIYLLPEQVDDAYPPSSRTDIRHLGIMLYEIVHGSVPTGNGSLFDGVDVSDLDRWIVEQLNTFYRDTQRDYHIRAERLDKLISLLENVRSRLEEKGIKKNFEQLLTPIVEEFEKRLNPKDGVSLTPKKPNPLEESLEIQLSKVKAPIKVDPQTDEPLVEEEKENLLESENKLKQVSEEQKEDTVQESPQEKLQDEHEGKCDTPKQKAQIISHEATDSANTPVIDKHPTPRAIPKRMVPIDLLLAQPENPADDSNGHERTAIME